jgi:uncharacterized repeat protein (TIGR01451 family)
MAGKFGLAAKLFLGTTVLAGGGTGAWYATNNGLPSLANFATQNATGEVDAAADAAPTGAPQASADLDAVASAWAEPASSDSTKALESSPVARSADAAPTSEGSTQVKPAAADRYSVAPPAETVPSATSPDAAQIVADQSDPQPTPAVEPPTATETKDETPAADSTAAIATEAVESETSLARGQEPKDEVADEFSSDAAQRAEPQPLTPSGQATSISATEDRARDAFRDKAAAPAGSRYGTDANRNIEPLPNGNGQQIVNPFGAAPGSDARASASTETIQPLPAPPNDIGGRLTKLQQTASDEQPRDSAQIGIDHGSASRLRNGQPIANLEGSTDSEFRGSLPSAGNGPANENIGPIGEGNGTGQPGERALEGPQKPALEIQKFAPSEIQVGKPAKFVVQVRNVGAQAAEEVIILDEVPQGTRLVSTTPTAQSEGGKIVWQLGKLSSGEDRTVEMQLMPTAEGEIGSVATVSYSAQASVKTKCTMPQLAIRMTAPNKVMIGQEQRVKIELRNPGSGDATGVMLFENVPQNVKHAAGPALEFDIGTLRAGETRELELVLLAEKAGKTVNVLSARADGNLQVQQQVEFEVIAPGLTVDVDGPERRYLERPATYEVSVENPGTAPAHDVQIVTKLPKGMRFIRANNMGEYDAATHAVYWSLAELPEGERGTVELVAMPIEAGPQTLEVESRAGEGLSDQTQRQIVVDGLAAIMFEVRDLEDPIEVGGETGYEIRVVNQGTKAAANLQVAVNLPPGMQMVSAEGETQHAEQRGAIVFEPLSQLAPKADTVYRVRVQGTAAGDQRVTVEVNTDDLAQPIRREESTTVFGDE